MDEEDFLAAVEADNAVAPAEEPKPEAETPPAETPKPEAEAPAAVEPAPNPAAPELVVPTTPEAEQPKPGYVPIAALLDTRDKGNERIRNLEAELTQLRAQLQPQPAEVPDRFEDPEGFEAYQDAQIQNRLLNITLNTSERFAVKEHGRETVEAAKQWALQRYAADPLYQAQVLRDQDPYERVVTDFKRDQLFSKVSDPSEFDAFLQWKAAQAQIAAAPPGAAPATPTPPAIPPRSLAGAPSAGGINSAVIESDEDIFAGVIPKR